MIKSTDQQAKIGLIFAAITFTLIILVLGYFFSIIQPKIKQEYFSYAATISQALGHELNHQEILLDPNLLEKELNKIINYRDEYLRHEFIKGLVIEFDKHQFPQYNRGLQRGNINCKNCYKTTSQLIDEANNIELGKITYYINPQNHQGLIQELTYNFFALLLLMAGFSLITWLIINRLWKNIINSEKQLSKATKYNQQILDTMQEIMLLIDHQGRILDSNLAARKRFNTTTDAIKSHFIQEYLQASQKNQRLLTAIKKLDPDLSLEVKFQDNDFYGLLSVSKFDPLSENSRFLVVIKDIHSLKTAQSRLDSQAKLEHTSRLKSLGEMATGIAHEINQPLAIIRLGAEGLKHKLASGDAQLYEVTNEIVNQVDRASSIINNMRSFSRVQPSPRNWMPAYQPLNNALSFFEEQLRSSNIQLTKNIDYACPEVLIEAQKFEQIIVNLIINAKHALEKINDDRNKKIQVSLACDHSFNELKITDNGVGMDESTLEQCMEPFFTTKEAGQGTGLGLSIVHNILEDFNIQLVIESALGKGTTFTLKIPHKVTGKNEKDPTSR